MTTGRVVAHLVQGLAHAGFLLSANVATAVLLSLFQ